MREAGALPLLGPALVQFAAKTRFEDLPDEVVHEARRYVVDTIGCALGGHAIDKGRIAAAHGARLGGPPEAAIIGHEARVSIVAAAFANAELANALDYDLIPHMATVVLSTMLAVAETQNASGRDLIAAVVVAHEIGRRLSRASSAMMKSLRETGNTPEAFGIDNESTIGCALGAGRLLNQTLEQMENALGLAAYFSAAPIARDWEETSPKSMVKYMTAGLQSQNALQAALLAGAGFTGNANVLDTPHGYSRFIDTGVWQPAVVTRDLGDKWIFMDLQYKPWPCCRFFHSQLDGLSDLLTTHQIRAEDIERIDAHGTPFVANARPYDTRNAIDAQFSLPFSMALVAHRVPVDARWQSPQTLEDARLHDFARRVHMHADPRAFEKKLVEPSSWWARVEVTTRDGRHVTDEREHAHGSNGTAFALSDAEISAKFLGNASIRLQRSQAEALLAALWSLDRTRNMRQLGELLAPR